MAHLLHSKKMQEGLRFKLNPLAVGCNGRHVLLMRHLNSRYAFVVSSPLDLRTGYGTAAAVLGLMQALHRKGKRVGLVEPALGPLPDRWMRWWFNLHVPRSLSRFDVDCIVGIDFDGYRYAKRKERRPFLAFLHGVKADEFAWETGAFRAQLKRDARRELVAAKHADLVLAPSAYACQRACEAYGLDPARTRVVPNGLQIEDWPLLPVEDGPPVVVTAARLIRRKGLDDLIRAWPGVLAQVPDGRLEIAGDGPQKAALQSLALKCGVAGSVHFLGARSQSEFRELLRKARVFCLPSRQEAFGLVLLEAMASGRPVVATRAAAIPEVLGEAGLLVPPGDSQALTEALGRALSDRALAGSLARAGRERALTFSWDRAAASFGAAAAEA
jgi:glycosyltransferase involved in cell wall biosynthesis